MTAEHDEVLERGVHNPSIIDLITADAERGQVVLVMIERRLWNGGEAQLAQLNDKLNAYFSYVVDGHLSREYPQYDSMPVRLQLDCVEEPRDTVRDMLGVATKVARDYGIKFLVRVVGADSMQQAPWEKP